MRAITELIVRVADLVEAEGRTLREQIVQVALGLSLLLIAAGVVVAGVALVLGSVYLATAQRAGPAAGAAVTGIFALGIGGGLLWLGRRTAMQ